MPKQKSKAEEREDIEVTEDMINAGVQALGEGSLESLDDEPSEEAIREDVTRVYRAMRRIAVQKEATKIALSLSKLS